MVSGENVLSGHSLGIILLILLIYLIDRNELIDKKKSYYLVIVIGITFVIIALDMIANKINGSPSQSSRMVAYLANAFGFSLMFFLPVLQGMLYSEKIFKYRGILLIPAIIGTVMCICSIQPGFIFWITPEGIYERGPLFFVNSVIATFGFMVSIYGQVAVGREYGFAENVFLIAIAGFTLIPTGIQIYNPDIQFMWAGIAISEMIYYILLCEIQQKFDPVTRTCNKKYFQRSLSLVKGNKDVFIVLFQLTNWKDITEEYGVDAGNEYLKAVIHIIENTYRRYGKIYRISENEFASIVKDCTEDKLLLAQAQMKNDIQEHTDKWKRKLLMEVGISDAASIT